MLQKYIVVILIISQGTTPIVTYSPITPRQNMEIIEFSILNIIIELSRNKYVSRLQTSGILEKTC